MALSQTSWDEIMRVVLHKLGEKGPSGGVLSPEAVLLTMRDNWELVCNKKACTEYLAEKDLADKKAARDTAIATARTLAAEIRELEGGA